MKHVKLYEEYTSSNPQTIILFGPQGVGKSTVARELAQTTGAEVIESDDWVEQGDWAMAPTWLEGWKIRKRNELPGMLAYLKANLGKKVILDVGGSHGVWEGDALRQILNLIQDYPNRFLILPSKSLDQSQAFLRKRLAGREGSGEGEHAETIRSQGASYLEFTPHNPSQKFEWQPGMVQDYSKYFITQMLDSGIVEPDHVVYLDEIRDKTLAQTILGKMS